MARGRIGAALVTAVGLAVLFACGGPLRQDELDCEEAVSVLEGCCPDFAGSSVQCVETDSCNGATYPAISEDDSACIRRESCAELVSSGVCQRAQQAQPYGINDPDASETPAQVCP
jgi:hypothetical protein